MAEARAPDFDGAWVDEIPELQARYGTRDGAARHP